MIYAYQMGNTFRLLTELEELEPISLCLFTNPILEELKV